METNESRILVVEDDRTLRGVVARILGSAGYRVVEAHLGAVALDLIRSTEDGIDLVVTDASLWPEGPGPLREALERHHPGARILFMSGYEAGELRSRGLLPPGAEFVKKPFSPRQLVARVREVLGRGPGGPGDTRGSEQRSHE